MKPWKFDAAKLCERLKGSPHVQAVALAELGANVLVVLGDFTTREGLWKSPQHSPSSCAIDIKHEAQKLGLLPPRAYECETCLDGSVISETCDTCDERHCPQCAPCYSPGSAACPACGSVWLDSDHAAYPCQYCKEEGAQG